MFEFKAEGGNGREGKNQAGRDKAQGEEDNFETM